MYIHLVKWARKKTNKKEQKQMTEFQERLNELLEEKNLSRLKLANSIGITSTTINGYFN